MRSTLVACFFLTNFPGQISAAQRTREGGVNLLVRWTTNAPVETWLSRADVIGLGILNASHFATDEQSANYAMLILRLLKGAKLDDSVCTYLVL